MKKLLLSIMAVAALTSAEAKKVKFQVDMTGQTVGPNGVHIAGDFQAAAGFPSGDWQPNTTTMTNGGGGDIYSVIVDVPAKTYYRFKFINGNDWAQVESVPAICQKGHSNNGQSDDNRWFFIDSLANDTTVIPAILFGGSAPAGKFAVRFAVDMRTQPSVSADGVHIAGTVVEPNWTPAANTMANLYPSNKIYEIISYVSAGTYAYKYVNGNAWGSDESVPSACNVGNNREVVVSNANIAVGIVCYASCIACPTAPIPTYSLRFQVDMSNSDCEGPFDSVTVAGAGPRLTSFGAGIRMSEIGSSKIFAVSIDSLDSGEVKFKFRAHRNGNTGWEGGPDRIFTLSSADTIDLTCFGSRIVGNCPVKPAPSTVTFKVDMTNETPGVVFVMGTYQAPNWQAGAIRMQPAPGEPGVFIATVNNVCPGSFNYKFVNATDGDSSKSQWEENFPDTLSRGCVEGNGIGGFNRKYTRTSDSAVTLYYVYNSCTVGGSVGLAKVSLSNTYKLYPNPAQSFTVIAFNDNAASHTAVLMDITGRVIQSFDHITANELTIPTAGLNQGIYFIKATNTRNESVTSKLIVR